MNQRISIIAAGHATSLLFMISFLLCIGFDLMFPEHAMYETWQKLLPGFEWISFTSVLLGGVESYGYGWYVSLIWVPIYNFSISKSLTQK